MDVCDREQVSATLAAVVEEHGGLDLLVNNAGITRHRPLVDLTWEDWSAVVDVNLHGVFNCLQAAGRIMIERGGGVIVNMASVAAERGAAGPGAVRDDEGRDRRADALGRGRVGAASACASTRSARATSTRACSAPRSPRARSTRPTCCERIPAGRLADPDEIGAMVSFLASPDAAYVNGQVFYVDGGFLADYGVNVQR